MFGAVELAPYAEVDTIVQGDRAPLVGARSEITTGATRGGVRREPLPIDVAGVAGDRLLDAAPPQRPGHLHAGLKVRAGVVLAEARDLPAVGRGAHRYRRPRGCDAQVQLHRVGGLVGADEDEVV